MDGPLWLSVGTDKVTGQLRPPVDNILARITGSSDVRGPAGTMTQVVNNFVTVQRGMVRRLSRTMQTPGAKQKEPSGNMQQLTITGQGPTVANLSLRFEIPPGTTVMKDILKQWVTTDPGKTVTNL